jgi:hypothetical protein
MKINFKKRRSRTNSACLATFLGIGFAMAHQVYHVVGKLPDENPFAHIVPELVGLRQAVPCC